MSSGSARNPTPALNEVELVENPGDHGVSDLAHTISEVLFVESEGPPARVFDFEPVVVDLDTQWHRSLAIVSVGDRIGEDLS